MLAPAKVNREMTSSVAPLSIIKREDFVLCPKCDVVEQEGFWIQCDGCIKWYHGICVDVAPVNAENIDKYICMVCADANPSLRTTYKPPVGLNILTHFATSGECSSNKDDVSSLRSVSCRECDLEPVVLPHLDTLEPFVNIASVKTTMQSKPLKGTKSSRLQSILKLVPSASQKGIVRDRPVDLKSAASTKNGIIPKKRDDERKNLVSERGLGKPSIGRNDLSQENIVGAKERAPMPSQAYVSVWRNSVGKRTVTTGLSDKVDTKKQRSKTVAPDATEDRTGSNELSERVPSASVGPQARRDNLAPTSKALDGYTTNFTGFKDDQPIHSGAPAELDEQPASERASVPLPVNTAFSRTARPRICTKETELNINPISDQATINQDLIKPSVYRSYVPDSAIGKSVIRSSNHQSYKAEVDVLRPDKPSVIPRSIKDNDNPVETENKKGDFLMSSMDKSIRGACDPENRMKFSMRKRKPNFEPEPPLVRIDDAFLSQKWVADIISRVQEVNPKCTLESMTEMLQNHQLQSDVKRCVSYMRGSFCYQKR